jgi:TonB family protein
MKQGVKKLRWAMAPALAALGAVSTIAWGRPKQAAKPESRRLVEEKTGTLTSREGLRLRLVTDLGSVRILTWNSNQVSYKVRIESNARDPEAQKLPKQFGLIARNTPAGVQLTGQLGSRDFRGRLWVNFEVTVPRNYNLDVLTQAGSIETQDIAGQVALATSGGSITVGRVGGPGAAKARLETQGGHINVQEMNGELRAVTAAGHIHVASMRGDAVLRSGGGHIRIGTIQGTAGLETRGGNISVERADGNVTAATGGGQIDFGEASGSIRARTSGGGIRVLRVSGPIQLETGGGSIFLTKVQGAVRATTGAGGITAWFTSDGLAEAPGKPKAHKLFGASQLESGQGDIVVYLPRELAVTIEALIETAAEHRIEADPDLPLKVSYVNSGGGRAVRGECALNGGGETLRLKTVAGNIRLKLSDTDLQMRLNQQQMDELRRHMELQQQRLLEWQRRHDQFQKQIERRAEQRAEELRERAEQRAAEPDAGGREGWGRKLEQLWLGGIRVDPDEQQKKLVHSVQPVYPDVAKQAGIEGTVRLRVNVAQDGMVKGVKVLSGEAVLANAAREAVQQWRYQPTVIEGKPMNVITTVTVEFRVK